MPWIGNQDFTRWQDEKVNHRVRIAELEAQLAAETNRRERVELEYSRLNDDFRGLIALTAGRIPPKLAPEFDRDPYAEDTSQAETFLSPDPDDLTFNAEEILQSLEDKRLEEPNLSG